MDKAKYVVDTSVFLRREPRNAYEEAAFPVHWKNFDNLVKEGIIISLDIVKEEIIEKCRGFYNKWVEDNNMFYPRITKNTQSYLNELSLLFPEWYDVNKNKADFYLVAFSKANNLILVTNESINLNANCSNYKIPSISYYYGANCIPMDQKPVCIDKEKFHFECICFNELVKREKLYQYK